MWITYSIAMWFVFCFDFLLCVFKHQTGELQADDEPMLDIVDKAFVHFVHNVLFYAGVLPRCV